MLSITDTHTNRTSAHTNFEVRGFIRSKPQEGRWWIRDKLAARSPACSLVCVSREGSLTPGEPVLPVTSRLVALMIRLRRSEKHWKLPPCWIYFIRTPVSYLKQNIRLQQASSNRNLMLAGSCFQVKLHRRVKV